MTTKRAMRAWMLSCVLAASCGGDDDGSATPDAGTQQDDGCPEGAICRAKAPVVEDLDHDGPYASATFKLAATADSAGATVYYPTSATAPYAYAVFCPPYMFNSEVVVKWGPFFASHGIVLATMDAADVNDYPTRRAEGLVQLVDALRAEHTRADSPLQGKLALERSGVLGWSMGGGAALTVTGSHPEWKSAILIAPHILSASGYGDSASHTTSPILILNGAMDTTFLGGMGQSDTAYGLIPASTQKMLYVRSDRGHFDWGGPTFAEDPSVGRYVMAWEKAFLEGDPRYLPFLKVAGPNATKFDSTL